MFIHNRSQFTTTCAIREPTVAAPCQCFLSAINTFVIRLVTFNFVESCINPPTPFSFLTGVFWGYRQSKFARLFE